jgi:hypothetical protein
MLARHKYAFSGPVEVVDENTDAPFELVLRFATLKEAQDAHREVAAAAQPPCAQPLAWVIPGDDTADANGFIAARVSCEGEFTKPLYGHPPTARISDLESLLREALPLVEAHTPPTSEAGTMVSLRNKLRAALGKFCCFEDCDQEPTHGAYCEGHYAQEQKIADQISSQNR